MDGAPPDACQDGGALVFAVSTKPAVPLFANHEGTPEFEVTNTPSFAVASAAITFALEAYNNVLTAFVDGYVLVVHEGVVEAPEVSNCPAVAVPASIAPAEDVE